MVGQLSRVEAPQAMLDVAMRAYCRAYDVDLSECEVPAEGFASFDAFFTRKLKPGVRPIDADPDVIVCPADGRVEDLGPIERGARLTVKGKSYSVVELLDDADATAELEGGSFAIVYLSPRDYHRVHAPVTGPVAAVRHVPGTLFPVNAIGLALHGIEAEGVARREMLSRDDLRGLAQSKLVTIGTMGGGSTELSDLSYDQARENLSRSIESLESATGQRPCDLAFASGAAVAARDIQIARDLGLASAVTQIEGSLWPEHARELLALPRIALDNDPATLVRALMLSGGAAPGGDAVFREAI
jgi:hypothetical protein